MPKRATFLFLAIAFVTIFGGCKSSVGITNPPPGNSGPPVGYFWVQQDSILWKQEDYLSIPEAFMRYPGDNVIFAGIINANSGQLQILVDSLSLGQRVQGPRHTVTADYNPAQKGVGYYSESGSISITALDSIRDLISGTFNFSMRGGPPDTLSTMHLSGQFNSIPYNLGGTMSVSVIDIGSLDFAAANRSTKNDTISVSGEFSLFGSINMTKTITYTYIRLSLHHPTIGSRLIAPDTASFDQRVITHQGGLLNETKYSNSQLDSVTITVFDTLHREISGHFPLGGGEVEFDKVHWRQY
jgi:hypothetical protein